MNRIVLVGRICSDVELKYTPNGVAVSKFRMAVDRPYAGTKRETDFFTVKVWRQRAETVNQYGRKGMLVAVEGQMQMWTNIAPDGTKRTGYEVVTDNFEFCERMPAPQVSTESDPFGDI